MKNKTIVEFIEEGTDRVISNYPIEEYNNMIESYNNLIPYKHLKLNKMEHRNIEDIKQELETVWFEAYYLLSNAGFEIYIDENGDGSMTVGHKNYEMVYDITGDKKLITQ